MTRGHRQVPHTADLCLELWAPDEVGVLEEGARAIVELLVDGAVVADTERRVVLRGLDPADRLVQWLNEVIVLAVTEGLVVTAAELSLDGAGGLVGVVQGAGDAHHRVCAELKAATYHDLALTRAPDGYRARVVIDV